MARRAVGKSQAGKLSCDMCSMGKGTVKMARNSGDTSR
jgi:hypothetical protein